MAGCLQEVRSIARARKLGVLTPAVYSVELEARSILMERVHGSSVKDCINNGLMDDAGGPQQDLPHCACSYCMSTGATR